MGEDQFVVEMAVMELTKMRRGYALEDLIDGGIISAVDARYGDPYPPPNVWLGTSIESDKYTYRADHLRETPAAARFLSLEPLLGPLPSLDLDGIDWVIVGGESGAYARPMHPSWVADIRDRCVAAGIPFLFKQWGEWSPGSLYAHEPQDRPVRVMLEDGRLYSYDEWQDVGHTVKSADVAGATLIARRGRKATGRELDGRTWDEFPQVVSS
jgi:protein gp37